MNFAPSYLKLNSKALPKLVNSWLACMCTLKVVLFKTGILIFCLPFLSVPINHVKNVSRTIISNQF